MRSTADDRAGEAIGAPVSEDVRRAAADALAGVADIIAGRVFSPRIRLLDIHDVCEALKLGERTVRTMMEEGRFPKPQEGIGKHLWRESAIIAWMDRNDPNLPR